MGTLSGTSGSLGNSNTAGRVEVDGNGNLYFLYLPSADTDSVGVWKSTDDGGTWAEQDTANRPTSLAGSGYATVVISWVLDGTAIHVIYGSQTATGKGSAGEFRYATFHTSDAGTGADTWQIDEQIDTPDWSDTETVNLYGSGIAVRSDGDVVVVYRGTDRSSMGAAYTQVGYNVRTSGTWGGWTGMTAEDQNQRHPRCVLGASDDTHISYWTDALVNYGVTLSSADSLGTRANLGISGSSFSNALKELMVFTPSGGSATVAGRTATTKWVDIAESSFPGTINEETYDDTIAGTGSNGFAWDGVTGDERAYVLWSAVSDSDLYYDWLADGDSTTNSFANTTEAEDAVTTNGVWATVYTQADNSVVLGYVFDNNGTLTWGEVELATGATDVSLTPTAIAGTTTTPAPTVLVDVAITATAIAGTSFIPTPTISTPVEITPAAIAGKAYVGTEGYLTLDGTTNNYLRAPNIAAYNFTGDIDIRVEMELSDWSEATQAQQLIAKRDTSDTDFYWFQTTATGPLRFANKTGNVVRMDAVSSAAVPFADGERGAVRVTVDVDNGSGGADATFYTAPSIDGPWTQLGTVQTAGRSMSLPSTTQPLDFGLQKYSPEFFGDLYHYQVYDGIDGTLVLDADLTDLTPAEVTAGSFTEDSSNAATVSINGSAWTYTRSFPQVSTGVTLTPAAIAGVGSVPAVTIMVDVAITATAIAATTTIDTPTVSSDVTVAPASILGTATIDAPVVTAEQGAAVTPAAIAGVTTFGTETVSTGVTLTLASVAGLGTIPTPTVSSDVTVTLTAIAGVATIDNPTVETGTDATVTPAAILGTGFVPAVTVSSDVTVAPAAVLGVATTPAVTVTAEQAATVTPAAITAVALVPGPTVTAEQTATVTPASVAAIASIPTVTVTAEQTATVTPAAIAATTLLPTPTITAEQTATVTPAAILGTATTPTPTISSDATHAATAIFGTATVPTLTVSVGVTVTPAAVLGTGTVPLPTVSAGGSVTVAPTAIVGTGFLPTVTVTAEQTATVTPTAIVGLATVPTVTVTSDATHAATAILGTASLPTVTVSSDATVTVTAIAAVATVPTVTVAAEQTANVAPVAIAGVGSVSLPTVEAGGNVTVAPTAIAATTTVPTPTVATGASVAPSSIAGVGTLDTPTVSSQANVAPAAVNAAATMDLPTVDTASSATVTPAAIASAATIDLPTVDAGTSATVAPTAVTATTFIPGVGIFSDATVTPTGIAGLATIPTPTIAGDQAVFLTPAAIAALATFPTPSIRRSDPHPPYSDDPVGYTKNPVGYTPNPVPYRS